MLIDMFFCIVDVICLMMCDVFYVFVDEGIVEFDVFVFEYVFGVVDMFDIMFFDFCNGMSGIGFLEEIVKVVWVNMFECVWVFFEFVGYGLVCECVVLYIIYCDFDVGYLMFGFVFECVIGMMVFELIVEYVMEFFGFVDILFFGL